MDTDVGTIESVDTEMCGICKNDILISEQILTPCKHVFCGGCFFKWMKRRTNCPICRQGFGAEGTNINIVETESRLERLIVNADEWEEYVTYLREKVIETEVILKAKAVEYKLLSDKTHNKGEVLRVKTEELNVKTEELRIKTFIIDSINANIASANYRNRSHIRRFGLQLN